MSCLFNSLSYFFKEDSFIIRQKICDYLEHNNPIIDGLDTKFILDMDNSDYIKNMRHSFTWGGAIEIQAACNIWNVKVGIRNIRDKEITYIEFIPICDKTENIIYLEWSGGHFEPIK